MLFLFTVKKFKTIAVMTLKLQFAEVGIFNVCGRHLFANPVTNLTFVYALLYIGNPALYTNFYVMHETYT